MKTKSKAIIGATVFIGLLAGGYNYRPKPPHVAAWSPPLTPHTLLYVGSSKAKNIPPYIGPIRSINNEYRV